MWFFFIPKLCGHDRVHRKETNLSPRASILYDPADISANCGASIAASSTSQRQKIEEANDQREPFESMEHQRYAL